MMQRLKPSRVLRSFIWTVTFMVVATGLVCLYGYNYRTPRYIQESRKMVTAMNLRYDAVPVNTTGATIIQWSAFGLLKVHKAASTTTQAIFLRYGWKRNLTFVLPPEYNAFRYPNIISTNESMTSYNILPPPPGKSYDILCHHVVYNKHAWDKVISPNAAKVGTVREPFSHFKSTLNYFNPDFLKKIKLPNPVRTYLQNPKNYDISVRGSFTNNRVAFEYGVNPVVIEKRDMKTFEQYMWDVLDKEFVFVLVNEKFDESLIIMRRKLNWELEDILYVVKNVRPSKYNDRYNVTEAEKPLHQDFAVFDYILYDFFSKKLAREISSALGFEEELEYFIKIKQMVNEYCRNVSRLRGATLSVVKSDWNKAFNITAADCKIMLRDEISFTQDIRRKQYGSATWTWP